MSQSRQVDRSDIGAIVVPQWGRVVPLEGAVPWLVVDPNDVAVEPIRRFLAEFFARGNSAGSVRSYAYGLLRWWRWLRAVDVAWDRATPAETRDLVLWLQQASKPRRRAGGDSANAVNSVAGKRALDAGYQPRTVRHSNAVVRSFYEFWLGIGEGPLLNPVPLDRVRGRRANAHHNELKPYRSEGRVKYNPKVPRSVPRAIPDEQWAMLFAALTSHRDRAIVAVAISNGARVGELLGVRSGVDLNWGEQLIRVVRKGTRAEQWLPVSPEALVWIRLYLADLAVPLDPSEPLWQTLRRRDRGAGLRRQPLNYEALRAVFRRLNTLLGTNWTMHDLRHTAALRMASNPALTLRDVQVILGHAHLSTTADIYLVEDNAAVVRRVLDHLRERRQQPAAAPAPAAGYDTADLDVLFGSGIR
ncbi:tyrosine-type recombinase/integrase [Nocardia takedensis]